VGKPLRKKKRMRLCEEKSKKRKSKAIGQTARAPPKI